MGAASHVHFMSFSQQKASLPQPSPHSSFAEELQHNFAGSHFPTKSNMNPQQKDLRRRGAGHKQSIPWEDNSAEANSIEAPQHASSDEPRPSVFDEEDPETASVAGEEASEVPAVNREKARGRKQRVKAAGGPSEPNGLVGAVRMEFETNIIPPGRQDVPQSNPFDEEVCPVDFPLDSPS